MNAADFKDVTQDCFLAVEKLLTVKGDEYAGSANRFANFDRLARELNLTPEQVWQVYFTKHRDAVWTYINDEANGVTRERSEPIEGRIHDMIAYLILLAGMIRRHEQGNLQ